MTCGWCKNKEKKDKATCTDRPRRNTKRKLDFGEPPERPSKAARNKLHKATYMAKLKSNPVAYEAFKLQEAQRARERRQQKKHSMAKEELLKLREQGRARQKAFRERHKATLMAVDSAQKPKTRSDLKMIEARREKNRLAQKKRRENMSSQKKRRERERNRAYYWNKTGQMQGQQTFPVQQQISEEVDNGLSDGARRNANYRLKKFFGTGLIVKLKHFVKSVSKKNKEALTGVGVHYFSPSKKNKREPRDLNLVFKRINKLRSKSVLQAKKKMNGENINPDLYKNMKTWKVEYAENYFEQKSQHLPCKKTISRHLKQKKILNKSIVNLYQDFIEEHGTLVSRATFFRRRPRHVLSFTKTPFRQCLCEVCLNPMLKSKVLNRMLPEDERVHSLKDIVKLTVCDCNNLACISRECIHCGVWKLDRFKEMLNLYENVEWTRWESVTAGKGTRIDLQKKKGTVEGMVEELKAEAGKLPMHDFVQNWQLKQYSKLCSSVPDGWAVVTLDFSENYLCEKQDQPQASYYGYTQVTVHPCVLYYKCECGERQTDNITVLTDELDHSSSLVNRIVKSLMDHLRENLPSLKKVVIFSDGCSSQYKSKIPFAHVSDLGKHVHIERCYFGARHGKNPCDALGGVLKQAATRAVKARQFVIQNAEDLFRFASETLSIDGNEGCRHMIRKFWLFNAREKETSVQKGFKPISIYGTRQLHSLLPTADGLKIRNLSCFCQHCVEGYFNLCLNGNSVSEWKSVKDWEKTCKDKLKLQKEIVVGVKSSNLNDAFLDDPHPSNDLNYLVDVYANVSRENFFKDVLKSMALCKTFADFENVVSSALPHISSFPLPKNVWPTVFDIGVPVDKSALALVPGGLEYLYPVCVDVDGSCMPRSLSLALFGSEEYHEEVRCRICLESVINKSQYLNLPQGDIEMLCTLSDCEGASATEVYEKEVMDVCKMGTFMGLWQLMAAATALNSNIMSVYPRKGQSCGQFHNRTVSPLAVVQQSPTKRSVVILWTSTRNDMVDEFWVANHVEPMFPLSEPYEISVVN